MKIRGHVDSCERNAIWGWVLDRDDPYRRLRLVVSCGTADLGTCVADRYRKDLADGGLGDGCCAFYFELPSHLSPAELNSVQISIDETGYLFPFRVGHPVMEIAPANLYRQFAEERVRAGRHIRKFKKCILHIGTEKTGSSSLQAFLSMNRGALMDSGYFIPRRLAVNPDEAVNHTHLAMLSVFDGNFDDELRRESSVSNHQQLHDARHNIFNGFCDEIEAEAGRCDTVILSNEHCHSRLTMAEEIQNLKDFLDHFCEAYTVVVYLRPQHELAISQYAMFIANGTLNIDMLPPLPPPTGYAKSVYTNISYFDYKTMLDRWSSIFSGNVLNPRIYARKDLRGGDVVSDFAADLETAGRDLAIPGRLNTSLSAKAQQFLVDFYRALSDGKRAGGTMLKERIRNAMMVRFPGPGLMPSRSDAMAFYGRFMEDNEKIRLRWFPNRDRLFEINFQGFPEATEVVLLSPEETMEICVEAMLKDQELKFSLTPEALSRLNLGLPPNDG